MSAIRRPLLLIRYTYMYVQQLYNYVLGYLTKLNFMHLFQSDCRYSLQIFGIIVRH